MLVNLESAISLNVGKESADTAIRFSEFFDTTPELWMDKKTSFELKKVWAKSEKEYDQIEPFSFVKNPDF